MSAECEAYVEEHSPFDGTTYMVHLRMAMIANETYHYRIFMSDDRMARLCRCSKSALQRARNRLIDAGYVRLISRAVGQRVAEYEFVFVKVDAQDAHPLSEVGVHLEQSGCATAQSTLLIEKNINKTNDQSLIDSLSDSPVEQLFDQVWELYPRKIGRKAALRAFAATIKAKRASATDLVKASEHYAAMRLGEDPKFTMHGSTFFGPDERWRDYVTRQDAANADKRERESRESEEEFKRKKQQEHEESKPMPASMKADLRKKLRGNL